MTLGKLLNFSVTQFPFLQSGIYFIGLLWGLNFSTSESDSAWQLVGAETMQAATVRIELTPISLDQGCTLQWHVYNAVN